MSTVECVVVTETKICSRCDESKPLRDYARQSSTKDGLRYACRVCCGAQQKAYYQKTWDARAEYGRAYRQESENVACMSVYQKDYRAANLEYLKDLRRRRYRENRGREVAAQAAYRDDEQRREEARLRTRAWVAANRERASDSARRRRARKRGVAYEPINTLRVAERDGWICGICGGAIEPALRYPEPLSKSLDHALPLSRGGSHTYDNVRITHLVCNIRRNAARNEFL